MTSEVIAGPPEPLPSYRVAVLGDAPWADWGAIERLIVFLTARQRDKFQIVLVSVGRDPYAPAPAAGRSSPPLFHARNWSVQLLPQFRGAARHDRDLCAWCDAAMVLGDPGPWRNLLRLFQEAGKPARVFTEKPRVPRNDHDPLRGL